MQEPTTQVEANALARSWARLEFGEQVCGLNQSWWEHVMLEGDDVAIREELDKIMPIDPNKAFPYIGINSESSEAV